MPIVIDATGKDVIADSSSPSFEPCQQAGSSIWEQLELDSASCFLLHHNRPRSNLPAADKVTDFHLNEITTPKLAVDCQVEQCPISQAAALIEVKSDLPYLLWF